MISDDDLELSPIVELGLRSIRAVTRQAIDGRKLRAFRKTAEIARDWLSKGEIARADAAEVLREIAVAEGLVLSHGESEVQAALEEILDPDQPTAVGPARRFPLNCFDDITLGRERRYVVKGLLPAEGLAVIWGPPKCGKSFLATDMLMHVAAGWEYRGRRVDQGGVVYLALEGAKGFEARAEAQRQHRKPPKAVPFYLMTERVNLVADHGALIEAIRSQCPAGPKVVCIDTLNRSLPGSESKDEDMAAYVRAADAIRDAFGCLVVIVHHSGVEKSRPRGHTSLTGAADAQLKVERDAAGNVVLTVEWMKDGAEGDVIVSHLDQVTVGQDEDGDDITSCVIVPVEGAPVAEKGRPKLPKGAQIALKALGEAIAATGEKPSASNHIPPGATVTTIDDWRTYAHRLGVSTSDKASARRMAFQRASENLIAAGLVGVWEPHAWIVGDVHR